jgi:hypothetical protein
MARMIAAISRRLTIDSPLSTPVFQGVPVTLRTPPAMVRRACGIGRSALLAIGTGRRSASAHHIAGCGAWAICLA